MTGILLWIRDRPLLSWALVGIYTVVVSLSHDWVQNLLLRISNCIGRPVFSGIALVLGIAGVVGVGRLVLRRPGEHHSLVRFYWIALLVLVVVACGFLMSYVSESIHFLQYALLAIVVFALVGRTADTILWITILGAVDEAYQYWILHRHWGVYFDFNDAILNTVGAVFGILLILGTVDLKKIGYPLFPRSIMKCPPFLVLLGTAVGGTALYQTGHLAMEPNAGPETWILFNRIKVVAEYWIQPKFAKIFHVLRPAEALIWLTTITWFFSLYDYLVNDASRKYADRLHRILSRVTWSTRYMPVLDGMRLVAILAVVLYHIETMLPAALPGGGIWAREWLALGNIGVQFFFAISGFILALPMLEARQRQQPAVSIGKYYLRRATRLVPPYLICLVGLFLLGMSTSPERATFTDLAVSSAYLNGFLHGDFSAVNFVAWSLEVEVQFYLLMPLIGWVCFRGRRPWLRRLLMAGACVPFMVRQAEMLDHFPHGLFLLDQIQFFVAGIIVADVWVGERQELPGARMPKSWRYDLLATVGFLMVPGIMLTNQTASRFVVPIGIGLWLYGVLRSVGWSAVLSNRWLAVLGGMCYTVYLYHWVILDQTLRLFNGFAFDSFWLNMLLIVPVLMLILFVVSTFLFLAFEKPFMGLRGFRRNQSSDR